MQTWISGADVARCHAAAKMIEADLDEAYFTCRERYGADVANMLLVATLRRELNDNPGQWPPPDNLVDKVNQFLRDEGLLS